MVDIFLYPGEPNPADVKLSDPTVLRGGAGSLDSVVTAGQGSQSVAAVVTIGGASLDAVVTLGQGSQSVAALASITTSAVVTAGQGSQSVAAVASVATSAVVTLGQGSQSVASVANVSTVATAILGQGSQSVQATSSVSIAATVALGQGSQSVAALASIGGGAALDAVVTLGQGSQSVAALATVGVAAPPVPEGGGLGSGGGRERVSFEDVDRIRKRLREIETKRRKAWKKPKELERQIEQIYRDLYETPYRDELPEVVNVPRTRGDEPQSDVVNKTDFSTLLKDMSATRQLLDLYQTYLDDEEAIALLLLL